MLADLGARVIKIETVDANTFVPGHRPVGGKEGFGEAKDLLKLLHDEIKAAFDDGKSEEQASKDVNVGKFSVFVNQDRIPQVVEMAYKAYRGELD
jgi:hypothetical protein